MAERQITLGEGSITYIKANQLNEGDEILGTYLGLTAKADQFGKYNHRVRTGEDQVAIVNSVGKLDSLLEKVATGSNVRIVYKGKQKISSGAYAGKSAHNFDVFVTEEATAAAAGDGAMLF
jgi:hypothetical protein